MTKFTISAVLDEEKNLVIQSAPEQNQGENNCTAVELSVPTLMAQYADFYLEFLCPKNKRYISPKLSKSSEEQEYWLYCCNIPSCVLQEEGFVQMQLVARNTQDNTLIYKSKLSNRASFFVHGSVNACETFSSDDYFAKANRAMDEAIQAVADMMAERDSLNQFVQEMNQLLEEKIDLAIADEQAEFELSLARETQARQEADEQEAQERQNAIATERNYRSTADGTIVNSLSAHSADNDNPHFVTKAQVGLGNVDNVRQYSAQNPNFTTSTPKANGVANAGTATTYSRSDHVHPTETGNVKYSETQSLTSAEKNQAKSNLGLSSVLLCESQNLSNSQKAQAQANLGLDTVLTYAAQDLTSAQKAQARSNLGLPVSYSSSGISVVNSVTYMDCNSYLTLTTSACYCRVTGTFAPRATSNSAEFMLNYISSDGEAEQGFMLQQGDDAFVLDIFTLHGVLEMRLTLINSGANSYASHTVYVLMQPSYPTEPSYNTTRLCIGNNVSMGNNMYITEFLFDESL